MVNKVKVFASQPNQNLLAVVIIPLPISWWMHMVFMEHSQVNKVVIIV